MIHTILFDLDGTLLNTIDDLADAGNWVCAQNGWPTFTVEQYKHMVGNGIPKLVERFSPESCRTPARLAETLAQFTARYDAHKEDKTAPYPGIPELLAALKAEGIWTAVFSNKADALCGGIIDHYFAPGSFALVRGSRPGVPIKPDPAGVYSLLADLGADPQRGHRHRPQRRIAGAGRGLGLPRRRRAARRRRGCAGLSAGGDLGLHPPRQYRAGRINLFPAHAGPRPRLSGGGTARRAGNLKTSQQKRPRIF